MSTALALSDTETSELSRFLSALGDPNRQAILVTLAAERLNVGDLSQRFALSRPAVSHHLKVLADAGVLKRERSGRETVYVVDGKRCRDLVARLSSFVEGCCGSRSCC